MASYYEILQIDVSASDKEVKQAYHRLALQYHPDKVGAKHSEKFKTIAAAYEVLGKPEKRAQYNWENSNSEGRSKQISLTKRKYRFLENPENYNFYDFFNAFFDIPEQDKLKPGVYYDDGYLRELSNAVDSLAIRLQKMKFQIIREAKATNPQTKINAELIQLHAHQLIELKIVLLNCEKKRALYDSILGVVVDPFAQRVESALQGKELLLKVHEFDSILIVSTAISPLLEANLLNPLNFKKVLDKYSQFRRKTHSDEQLGVYMGYFNSALKDMLDINLLTQTNFDFLLKYAKNYKEVSAGLGSLGVAKIDSQAYFEIIVKTNNLARLIGHSLRLLKEDNLLNEINAQTIINRVPTLPLYKYLCEMEVDGDLNESNSDVLLKPLLPEFKTLSSSLDTLFAHGLYLLSCDPKMGKAVMLFALELKKDLLHFAALPNPEKKAKFHAFHEQFLTKIHAKDAVMSTHRQFWKVIVANILIALTGVGALILGAKYRHAQQGFFSKTKSQQLVDEVDAKFQTEFQNYKSSLG